MRAYDDLNVYYGDLHNHCDISYGHGGLETAFRNAREQLDFCSVTGHALWPDMPEADATIQYIVDFHEEGFARLRRQWDAVQRTTEAFHRPGDFVTFLSFEMHGSADGDYTVVYPGAQGEILAVDGLPALQRQLRTLHAQGVRALAFPHHIGYKRGQRGINWAAFDAEVSPVVEILSMHGCSEADEGPRPFLHVMGPADHQSTMQTGLAQGHRFGVIGSTDHHSAHPGSYGHGRAGVWATAKTRAALWDALWARRTYALTGDRIALRFSVNGAPMGAVTPATGRREIAVHVGGGAPIDYVDVVKNNALWRRISPCDVHPEGRGGETGPSWADDFIHTKLFLEVGWGERGVRADWDVRFGVRAGRLLAVEPRFRGPEVVAPTEVDAARDDAPLSHWERDGERSVRFQATTFGNPNNRTPATQGLCLDVEVAQDTEVWAEINGRRVAYPLSALLAGARAGRLGKIASPCYRFHRAPRPWEFDWRFTLEDTGAPGDVYYVRVRQVNDQWAWSSPIWIGRDLHA
ncbi:MAG: DUF3604 domain-containing protein [Anaerolineae bacterium]